MVAERDGRGARRSRASDRRSRGRSAGARRSALASLLTLRRGPAGRRLCRSRSSAGTAVSACVRVQRGRSRPSRSGRRANASLAFRRVEDLQELGGKVVTQQLLHLRDVDGGARFPRGICCVKSVVVRELVAGDAVRDRRGAGSPYVRKERDMRGLVTCGRSHPRKDGSS